MPFISGHVVPYQGVTPTLADNVFVAHGAAVIGNVNIGTGSSVWYNVTLRGDVHHISIGENTNIQDGTVGHVTSGKFPLIIGNGVTIGHNATVHACTVGDYSLIGMGSVILDGAVIEPYAMVAAGAVVSPGKVVKSGELWAGVPAKFIRHISEEERTYLTWSATHYAALAAKSAA